MRGSGHNKHGGYTEDPRRRTRRSSIGWRASTSAPAEAVPAPDSSAPQPGATSASSRSAAVTRAVREAVDRPRRAGHQRRLHAHQGVPLRRERQAFIDAHDQTSSSSRTATRSCARCSSPRRRVSKTTAVGARLRRLAALGTARRRRASQNAHWQQVTVMSLDRKSRPSAHPSLTPNKLGLALRDYEGAMSTLCAGCGHDSVTAAIVRVVLGARRSRRT